VGGTDVTAVLVAGIPELNTAILAAGVLCLLGLARRMRQQRNLNRVFPDVCR